MTKEIFSDKRVSQDKLIMIGEAHKIIKEYMAAGYVLTLRQLYYQFVARDMLPNTVQSYKKLGDAVSDGRMLGLLDWDAIEDRTRGVEIRSRWDSPAAIMQAAHDSYHVDMWANQDVRVEVWIEKEALVGVIESVCRELDVPYLACRGYVSQSEQWRAYRRLQSTFEAGQRTVILHFGDHDPSGIDMTRDNRDRLAWFMSVAQARRLKDAKKFDGVRGIEVRRLALNMEQIEEYNPPPNPAKATDSRFESYRERFGDESWELDALEPRVIVELIRNEVDELRDPDKWAEREEQLAHEKAKLAEIIDTLE